MINSFCEAGHAAIARAQACHVRLAMLDAKETRRLGVVLI